MNVESTISPRDPDRSMTLGERLAARLDTGINNKAAEHREIPQMYFKLGILEISRRDQRNRLRVTSATGERTDTDF